MGLMSSLKSNAKYERNKDSCCFELKMWKANNLQGHQIVSVVKLWQAICLKKCQNVRHATDIISKHVVECHQDETCGNYLNVGTYEHKRYTLLKNHYSHATQDLAIQLTKH